MMTADGGLIIQPTSYVAFIDETGHEELADVSYPFFGLGGCAVMGADYLEVMDRPWRILKRNLFGDGDAPFHAAGSKFSSTQAASIGEFFRSHPFARFATVAGSHTEFSDGLNAKSICFATIIQRILDVAKWQHKMDNIILVLEHSSRLAPIVERHLGPIQFQCDGIDLPVTKCFAKKAMGLSGLEIADAIIHAAGRQAALDVPSRSRLRQDFKAVFNDVGDRLASYVH
jgi:hypothetical protein